MRYYHQRGDALPRFASTIFWFVAGANVLVFGIALTLSGPMGAWLFDDLRYLIPLRLMLVNTLLIAATFLPFHSMRMHGQAAVYSGFAFARSVGSLALRIALVVGAGLGL